MIDDLSRLRRGWLSGEGEEFSNDDIDWLKDVFNSYLKHLPVLPYIYPTPEGGVMMEWTVKKKEISIEVDLLTHQGVYHSYDFNNNETYQVMIDLDIEDSYMFIERKLCS